MILAVLISSNNISRQIVHTNIVEFELLEKEQNELFDIIQMPEFRSYTGIALVPSIACYMSNEFSTVVHIFEKLKMLRTIIAMPVRHSGYCAYVMSTEAFFQFVNLNKVVGNMGMNLDNKISWLCTQSNFERCDYSGMWS